MRIGLDVLRRFTDLPEEPVEVRRWMDRVGLEVKRVHHEDGAWGFTLELLANRGDHHCYDGIARELASRLDRPLHRPEVTPLEEGPSPWPLRLETDDVLRYSATLLVASGPIEPLSPEHRRVLEAGGMQPVGAVVDATNVANLELGQPTHAFDADTIRGAVTLRHSRPGERAWPLFAAGPTEVPAGTLVVADDDKILAIAGVIGCEESKTTERTRRILLESATFDPVAVRKAARGMGITTDSSARFERGADPARIVVGAGRVVRLLEETGAWKRSGPTGLVGGWQNPGRVIRFREETAWTALGMRLDPADLAQRLARQGFETRREPDGHVRVSVPTWRLWDVEFPADVFEEIAKSVGYENFTPSLPPIPMGSLPSVEETARQRADEVLVGFGFYEVFTDGFYGRNVIDLLGIREGHPLFRHVETTNALDRAYSLLKNNGLHQALLAVATNERRRVPDVKMFEWTRTFHPVDGLLPERADPRRPPCAERRLLWLVASGRDRPRAWHDTSRPVDLAWLRGLVHELSVELGADLEVGEADHAHPLFDLLHPHRRQGLVSGGRTVGILGEPHPAVSRRYKLKQATPVYLEIDADALLVEGTRPAWTEPPSTQLVVRSLAFGLPRGVEGGDVAAVLHANGPDWLDQVLIVDLFRLDAFAAGEPDRAITYELRFEGAGADEAPRTAEEINAAVSEMIAVVLEQFGPMGVRQR